MCVTLSRPILFTPVMNIGLSYSHVILIISTEAPSGASSVGGPEQGGLAARPLLPRATAPLHAYAL